MSFGKPIFVLKFGGTSVKTIARMQHAASIVGDFCKLGKVVVVVSAMGDTTDHLLTLASQCSETPDRRELGVLLSTGEQVSIALFSIVLRGCGLTAKSFTGAQAGIVTESCHGSARIVDLDCKNLKAALRDNDVCVVAGFQGVTVDGDITTLGRGGSDTTAVALAAALKATECHVFTDVDGIFSADPNRVANAEFYPEIGYEECLNLVNAGAQVMHDRAVSLAKQYGVVLRVRNTFKPEHDGTLIAQLDGNLQRTRDEAAA